MVVTFFGHADFNGNVEYEEKVLSYLEENIGDRQADMYLGGYGGFDRFALECCLRYKKTHPGIALVFVTPYRNSNYQKNRFGNNPGIYDLILYPEIEDKPLRFAITYRNMYMVEKCECAIAYVSHKWGGAYTTYRYAKRKGKKIYNLANFDG